MSVIPSVLTGGSNTYQTPPEGVQPYMGEFFATGVIGFSDLKVTAQGSPNMTVSVASGAAYFNASPTSEAARYFRSTLSASANVTIPANATGSTRYDLVYMTLPAATLHTPGVTGDFTEAATLGAERHTSSGQSLTVTNAILLAEVVVANGASSITTGNITDKRTFSGPASLAPSALLLGYASIAANFTSTNTATTDITGLTISITVPVTNRMLCVELYGRSLSQSAAAGNGGDLMIRDGSNNIVQLSSWTNGVASQQLPAYVKYVLPNPPNGTPTYKASFDAGAAGTFTLAAASGAPAFIMATLI